MKKLFRVCFCVALCFMMLLACVPNNGISVLAMEDLILEEDIDIEFCQKQAESIEQYQQLLESFNEKSKVKMSGQQMYDENYGGAYIGDEGELVVLLVECDEEKIGEVQKTTGNDSIKTEDCDYSYNDLMMVIETINFNLEHLSNNGILIGKMCEDVYNNCVKIGVIELTKEKEDYIRAIIDMPCMEIYDYEQQATQTTAYDIKGGTGIKKSSDNTYSTVGFCATRNGIEGYVIAGHAGDTLYENFTYSGTSIGYVTATAFYNYTNADAAFLRKGANVNTTAKIYAGSKTYTCASYGTSLSDYPIGASIYKYGTSAGLTGGVIVSNATTVYADIDYDGVGDMYLVQQSLSNYYSIQGDSGGPVFMINSDGTTCKLLGIQSCICLDDGGTRYSSFSRYYNIANELNVIAITK